MAIVFDDDDEIGSFTNLAAGIEVPHYKIISKIGAREICGMYTINESGLLRQSHLNCNPDNGNAILIKGLCTTSTDASI